MDRIRGHINRSQVQKDKCLNDFSHLWNIDPKDKYIQKNKHNHVYPLYEEQVCNSGTTLWNLRKEGRKKRMIEHQHQNSLHLCRWT
jgi:hypothetical protein